MRKNICLGLGATLAFAVSAYAQNYKINKVGNDEEKSFNVLFEQNLVEEAVAGSWLSVTPNTPEGKVFKGFTVYDEYGDSREQRKVSTTEKNDSQFVMPDHDVFVTASFESLRYYLTVKNTDNGSVSLLFNDRYRDRTKPGVKVTVNPNASNGYKVASVSVVRALDANTVVPCTKVENGSSTPGMWGMGGSAAEGSCAFDMPNFDVEVSAVFVSTSVDLSSSSSENVLSSSSVEPESSSDVEVSSSSVLLESSSSAEIASNSSSSRNDEVSSSSEILASSSSTEVASSSSEEQSSSSAEVASSSSEEQSSSSAEPSSSSVALSSSSADVASSSSESVESSSSLGEGVSSSSEAPASSSSVEPASSSSVKAESSSSSAIQDIVVEAVGTEEDMPSCTVKRENMTFYVTELKTVFVCKSRVWTKFNPGLKIANLRVAAKFSATVNGRSLQISGAKIGADVNLLDMQGRVIYNGRANDANFSMNAPRSGSYVLRIGAQQRIVNVR
ncbi:InlB B-repeat-containing protein [Fibrobacter succinogenes]|uniref:Bacterial repeat domain-containing protein n=1 Tax=Fibrobacter succinogenes TaxID=833 RepID=A0A380RUH8_FIBSU|nr:hypothetical protein [Fibrobacter succinogenes]PWJ36950.1 hypothetical protein IE02_0426 [Fibrobacter succinogenes subsp. elongatus]SUQ19198.1 hypothetical protein SAMN05661053_0426 [Fibrobacter succinogenes]